MNFARVFPNTRIVCSWWSFITLAGKCYSAMSYLPQLPSFFYPARVQHEEGDCRFLDSLEKICCGTPLLLTDSATALAESPGLSMCILRRSPTLKGGILITSFENRNACHDVHRCLATMIGVNLQTYISRLLSSYPIDFTASPTCSLSTEPIPEVRCVVYGHFKIPITLDISEFSERRAWRSSQPGRSRRKLHH